MLRTGPYGMTASNHENTGRGHSKTLHLSGFLTPHVGTLFDVLVEWTAHTEMQLLHNFLSPFPNSSSEFALQMVSDRT